jgi:hypothetical protein
MAENMQTPSDVKWECKLCGDWSPDPVLHLSLHHVDVMEKISKKGKLKVGKVRARALRYFKYHTDGLLEHPEWKKKG